MDRKIVVIVGPTGSGKTGVAIEIAEEYEKRTGVGCEIISADSRAIYKYMDVGTAKPTELEQKRVKHWGIDLVEPGERFTVADWKAYTEQKICTVRDRGKVPIIVGGTGLYVDSLVFNYQFTQEAKENYADRDKMDSKYAVFGIKWDMAELKKRLEKRSEQIFCTQLLRETEFLEEKYGWGSQAMKSNAYQFAAKYLRGEISLEEAKRLNTLDDYHLAKRQMTWFKRNPEIVWLPLAEIKPAVLKCM